MIRIAVITLALIAGVAGAEISGLRLDATNVGTGAVASVVSASDCGNLLRLQVSNSVLLPVQIESANDNVQIYATTGLVGSVTITNMSTPFAGITVKSGLAANLAATTNRITIRMTLEK